MSRRLTIACMAMGLLFGACHKESIAPTEPTEPTAEEVHPSLPTSGIYHPQRRIDQTLADEARLWLWSDGELTALASMDNCGGYNETHLFDHTDGRLRTMQIPSIGDDLTVSYLYDEGLLAQVKATANGIEQLSVSLAHDSEKHPRTAHIELEPYAIGYIVSLPSELPLSFHHAIAEVELDWDGANVRQQRMTVYLESDITMGQLRSMVDLEQIAGSFAYLLDFIDDETHLPVDIALYDTTSYSFDTHPNPFCGLLYQADATLLCANNVLSAASTAASTITISFPTPLGDFPYSIPYPFPSRTVQYTYSYDSVGYPTEVVASHQSPQTIIYQTE